MALLCTLAVLWAIVSDLGTAVVDLIERLRGERR